ncbi:MAG: Crp/Fnr family transcriptional regulator [Caldilineaceae bacterium]
MSTAQPDLTLLADKLQKTFFFQGMDGRLLERLLPQARQGFYAPGAVIFLEGEATPGLYYVEQGWVKVIKLSPEGREQILYFWGAGDLFGGMTAFVSQLAPATALALEPTTLWLLPHHAVQQLLIDEPTLALRVIEFMSQRLNELITLVADLSLHSVTERLARQLLDQATDDIVQRQRWATQAEMAARLGTAPDVVNRALRALVEEGIIELSRQQIRILDHAALEDRAAPPR